MGFPHFPEVALTNILARLPLKSIAIFRSVNKEWRSLLDSDFFRDYYISQNSSSSSSVSWSNLQTTPNTLYYEIVGHHGCQRWGLSRSPGSFPSFYAQTPIKRLIVLACTDGLVSIYVENYNGVALYYVGNPLLQDWFRIPLPPSLSSHDLKRLRKSLRLNDAGLVTKMENGVVVSYKVVWMLRSKPSSIDEIVFMVYSSDTGLWDSTTMVCASLFPAVRSRHNKSIALNGILPWLSQSRHASDACSVVAYDFYGASSHCRVIHFPLENDELRRFRRTFTTTEGSIVYFNEFDEIKNRILRVWRLVKYEEDCPEAWQLIWEINSFSLMNQYKLVVPLNVLFQTMIKVMMSLSKLQLLLCQLIFRACHRFS